MTEQKIGIWIDKKQAIIISLGSNGTSVTKIESDLELRPRVDGETNYKGRFGSQGLSDEKTKEHRLDNQRDKFLKNLIEQLKDAEELVLFGPAEMKNELKKEIEKHTDLAKRLKGVKTTTPMSENQLTAWVCDFFGEKSSI